MASMGPLRDGRRIDIPGPAFLRRLLLKKLDATEIGELLKEYKLISE
jgi:oleate hydratase